MNKVLQKSKRVRNKLTTIINAQIAPISMDLPLFFASSRFNRRNRSVT